MTINRTTLRSYNENVYYLSYSEYKLKNYKKIIF